MASRKLICCSAAVMFVLCLAAGIPSSSGSAIPMWEYLSRGEKMSHLYTMFAKQVNDYCKSTATDRSMKPQCKRDLLMHGLGNLNKMDETHLDSMDPYQRGAIDIVWDHMMDGHPMMAGKKEMTTAAPIREPTGMYQHNPLFDEPEQKQKLTAKPMTHEDYAMGMDMDPMNGAYTLPKEQENLYPEPQNHLQQETIVNEKYVNQLGLGSGFLDGPMMVMVRPDGTPVHSHLPKDDDQEAMTLGREKIPTVEQIATNFGTTRNFIGENHDIVSTVQPAKRNYRTAVNFGPQKRSFFYYPSYTPQGQRYEQYQSNQH